MFSLSAKFPVTSVRTRQSIYTQALIYSSQTLIIMDSSVVVLNCFCYQRQIVAVFASAELTRELDMVGIRFSELTFYRFE